MAVEYKVLGQSAPANTSNANLYTVPAGRQAVVSTVLVTNTTVTDAKCRIFVRVAGATAAQSNAVIYDADVTANDFKAVTIGITLGATDVITVYTNTANALTFQAYGSEIA